MPKPTHGDAVLIGLVGLIALHAGFIGVAVGGLVLVGLGLSLLAGAAVLFRRAGPLPWTRGHPSEGTWVTLACPSCDHPLTWVDELDRWYCHACKAYVPVRPIRKVLELAR